MNEVHEAKSLKQMAISSFNAKEKIPYFTIS